MTRPYVPPERVCLGRGCTKTLAGRQVACGKHWDVLPARLRDELVAAGREEWGGARHHVALDAVFGALMMLPREAKRRPRMVVLWPGAPPIMLAPSRATVKR